MLPGAIGSSAPITFPLILQSQDAISLKRKRENVQPLYLKNGNVGVVDAWEVPEDKEPRSM